MTRHDSQRDPEASDGPSANGSSANDTTATGTSANDTTGNSMGDVDHTHPHRNTTFGSVFGRGPTVAADGGSPVGTGDDGRETMADVDHESPTETDADGWFDRGVGRSATEGGAVAGADSATDSGTEPGGVASDE